MSMDYLEKLNCSINLTEARKEHVEKAMLSLLAEWKNLETHLDSSTHRLLRDCFTDIRSREARLNEVKQSVTRSNEVINEMRSSLENRIEEVARREREFERFYEVKCAELGFEERRVEEKRREVEGRFEVVRLKEKSIENREVKLEVISKNLVEREKEVAMMREVNEKKSKEVESMEESFVSKEKEIEMVKITHDLCKEFNLQKEKLDLEKKLVDERVKELEIKEKCLKERVETIDKREKEIDAKNVLSNERCKGDEIREKKLEDRLKQFELKEKRLKVSLGAMDLKKKEIELKNVSSEERCRTVEIREKKLEDQLKEFELKEKHFKEWVKTIDLKEKEIDSVRVLNEERCKKLDSMEKTLQELLTGLKLKEQHENRVERIEVKEKEVHSIRISCEERCRKFELEKKKLEDQMKESEMKKEQLSNVDHSIVKSEPCSVDGSYADIRFSITMDGKNLLLYLINQKRDLDSMTDKVFRVLRMSRDPGEFVLDAMQDFFLTIEDKEFEGDVVCKSSILLLEQLRRISTQIQPPLKKAAMELAHEWENKMKSSGEVTVFLNLLASYGLGTAFNPEEFFSHFEVIGQQIQISKLCQLLGYTEKISDLIQVMLKEQQHIKAVKYVCAFGLHDKFKPASLLKDLLKNSEEASKTLRENSDCPVDKKDEAIDNIILSLREALVCIFRYKLDLEYPPECIERFITQLIQQKEDEKVKLSASNNDAAEQEADKSCKSATVLPDPSDDCATQLKASCPMFEFASKDALATILFDMDRTSLLLFLNENLEDHELLGIDILNVLKLSKESAKLVLYDIKGKYPPHSEMGDKNFDSPVTMRSCILLLEQLMKQSPKINNKVKADAMQLASDWKAKMRTPLQVLGFLHLICTYGLKLRFEVSELERHFESVSDLKHSPELCRVFRLSDKRLNQTTTLGSCRWHQNDSSGLEMNKKEDNKTGFLHSANLAKLVLDAIRNCYHSNLVRKRIVKPIVVNCFIFLLEKLLTMSPQIEPHVRKKAAKFAVEWKAQLLDITSRKPAEIFGLFHLLAFYKVASSVDTNELLGLLDSIYIRRKVPELVRLMGLGHKIPDFVESLIQKGDRLQAIRYIYEFELVGKFLPVPILKDHLSSKKVMEMSRIQNGNIGIISKQLGILKGVVKCIKDHRLEVEYPPEDLLAQIQNLEEKAKEVTERSQSYKNFMKKKHVSGSDPRPGAQTYTKFKKRRAAGPYPGPEAQWPISKHPRIEPPVGSSLNVPYELQWQISINMRKLDHQEQT